MPYAPLKLGDSRKSTDLDPTSLTLSFFFYEIGVKITILYTSLKVIVKIKYNTIKTSETTKFCIKGADGMNIFSYYLMNHWQTMSPLQMALDKI